MTVTFEPDEIDVIIQASGQPIIMQANGHAHDHRGNLVLLFSGPITCQYMGNFAERLLHSLEPPIV